MGEKAPHLDFRTTRLAMAQRRCCNFSFRLAAFAVFRATPRPQTARKRMAAIKFPFGQEFLGTRTRHRRPGFASRVPLSITHVLRREETLRYAVALALPCKRLCASPVHQGGRASSNKEAPPRGNCSSAEVKVKALMALTIAAAPLYTDVMPGQRTGGMHELVLYCPRL